MDLAVKQEGWHSAIQRGSYHFNIMRSESTMPDIMFKRLCRERTDIFMALFQNEIVLKLTQGETPFLVDPAHYPTVNALSASVDLMYHEVHQHLGILKAVNLVTYYDRYLINMSFFTKREEGIECFAVPNRKFIEVVSKLKTVDMREYVMELLMARVVVVD